MISFLGNASMNFFQIQPVRLIREDKHIIALTVREMHCAKSYTQ